MKKIKEKKIVNKALSPSARKLTSEEYRMCRFRWHPGMGDKAISLRAFQLKNRQSAFEEVEQITESSSTLFVYTALKDASGDWIKESLWNPKNVIKCSNLY